MKKKRKLVYLILVLLFLLFIGGFILLVSTVTQKENVQKREGYNYKKNLTITCTSTTQDDVNITEEVVIENSVLILRRDIASWYKGDTTGEKTCKYYTSKASGLAVKQGITCTTNCDERQGTSTTVYTISELDKEDVKLKQFEYINEKDFFDYYGWMTHMRNKGYDCKES